VMSVEWTPAISSSASIASECWSDMYNNDVGKGVVYAYEAYEAK
jgi:hypothetical protein